MTLPRLLIRHLVLATLPALTSSLFGQEEAVAPLPKINVDPYASLRATLGLGEGGEMGIVNKLSRLGVQVEAPLWNGFSAIGRYEAGINLVDQNSTLSFSGGDDNPAAGQGSQAVTTRLGFVGFKSDFGTVTMGKQWSVFYDIGEWTDAFNQVGGDASGTYNVGTDGGISGTGRAENALIYRPPTWGPLDFGFQVQLRKRTGESTSGADTWSTSVRWKVSPMVSLGGAINVVRDGVDVPGPLEPKTGDQAAILGLKIKDGERWSIALTVTKSKAHEIDDAGTYFDGLGAELYGNYQFKPKWIAYLGYNDLRPTGSDYLGQYHLSYAVAGVQWTKLYTHGKCLTFVEAKLDNGKTSLGAVSHGTAAGFGLQLTF